MTLDDLRRALLPLSVRIANVLGRGVITGVDDAKKVQELQISGLEGEVRDEVEHFQPYGLSANPPKGLAVVLAWFGGRRDHGIALGVGDGLRARNLPSGEVALYSVHGQVITLKTNGDIELTPKSGQKVRIASDVDVTGTLTASVDVVGGGKHLATHTHPGAGLVVSVPSCTAGGTAGTVSSGVTGAPS